MHGTCTQGFGQILDVCSKLLSPRLFLCRKQDVNRNFNFPASELPLRRTLVVHQTPHCLGFDHLLLKQRSQSLFPEAISIA